MNPPQTAPLEEVAEHVTVAYVGPTSEFFRDTGIPYLRTGNVGVGRLLLNDVRYVTEAFHRKNQKSALKTGDVLVTRVISDEINCGIVPAELGEANCGNVIAIRPGDRLVPNYLIHLIRSPEVQRLLIQRRVGSAQSVVNTSVLKAWKVPLLSVGVQRRIAAVLDRAEAPRAKRRAALAQLDTLTQSIFLTLFGDPGENPKAWPMHQVSDYVAEFQGGKSLEAESGENVAARNRVLKISAVTSTQFEPDESKPVPDSYEPPSDHFVRPGDLLFSRANTPELVGAVAYVERTPPNLLLPDKLWRFVWRAPVVVEPLFVRTLFHTPALRREIARRATGTSGSMKNISQEKLFDIRTILPPRSLQAEFVRRSNAVDKLKSAHRASLAKLDALFASLQHRAFRGEL